MDIEMLPFFLGFAVGLGCSVAAAVLVVRALKPFSQKKNTIKLQLHNINLEKARKDAFRLAQATTKIAQLRSSLGG